MIEGPHINPAACRYARCYCRLVLVFYCHELAQVPVAHREAHKRFMIEWPDVYAERWFGVR